MHNTTLKHLDDLCDCGNPILMFWCGVAVCEVCVVAFDDFDDELTYGIGGPYFWRTIYHSMMLQVE